MDAFYPKTPSWSVKPVERAIAMEGEGNVTALVACDEARSGPRLDVLLKDVAMPHATDLHADNCDVYEPPPNAGERP